ncbi:MAG TPA: rhodanese-like domain-containing protein, partial [Longimicrobiaceae bacterium]|nr:rhodanese-like domain-containing protein [Longimicrobiaceae bacterium]
MQATETTTIPPVIRPEQLEALLRARPEIRLLDVRTPGEYETVHIRGAYNVPLDTLGEHGPNIRAHDEQPVVLICQSGQRARRAEAALQAAGMPNLHVLDGGVNGWVAAGRPVERGGQRLSLERQVRIAAGALAAAGGV